MKIKILPLLSLVTLLLFSSNPSFADANNGKGRSTQVSPSSQLTPTPSTTSLSQWISPKLDTKSGGMSDQNVIKINAGSAIPLNFKLFNSGVEYKSTKDVLVTGLVVPCIGVTPTPTATTFNNSVPGKSQISKSKSGIIRYSSNGFTMVWKTQKSASGCFQFRVSYPTGILTSPLLMFVK